jgi:hypothetical protein
MLYNLPRNEITDVIFLTNTANDDVFEMTNTAIKSLIASEDNNRFNVIVVESGNTDYDYGVFTIPYKGEFSYNKALNLAFDRISNSYVAVFNNDVLFTENWYSNIRYYMDIFGLDSASPWCPLAQNGVNPLAQQKILQYPPDSVILGYEPILTFAGWGWIMKIEVLVKLLPFPEDLTFWFQDNHMCNQLKTMGYKHGTVTASKVVHFGQKSYSLIDESKLYSMTNGLYHTFVNKWVNK